MEEWGASLRRQHLKVELNDVAKNNVIIYAVAIMSVQSVHHLNCSLLSQFLHHWNKYCIKDILICLANIGRTSTSYFVNMWFIGSVCKLGHGPNVDISPTSSHLANRSFQHKVCSSGRCQVFGCHSPTSSQSFQRNSVHARCVSAGYDLRWIMRSLRKNRVRYWCVYAARGR